MLCETTSILSSDEIASMFLRSTFLHERNCESSDSINYTDKDTKVIDTLVGAKSAYIKNYGLSLKQQVGSIPEGLKADDFNPDWYVFLNKAISSEFDLDQYSENDSPLCFAFSPFIDFLDIKLKGLFTDSKVKASDKVINSAKAAFYDRLIEIGGVTLYVEYQDYCYKNQVPQSKKVYQDWSLHLIQGGWYKVAYKYPVLIRFIATSFNHFLKVIEELVGRFEEDYSDIKILLGNKTQDLQLDDIEYSMSDPHNNEHTVCRLFFDNGKTIIYKPKPLVNEKWFFENIVENFQDIIPALGKVNIFNKGEYGWAQDINSIEASSQDNIDQDDIYKIAILFYLLNATDMHSENIVRVGDKFYPADLETILNTRYRNDKNNSDDNWKIWNVLSTELLKYKFSNTIHKNRGGSFAQEMGTSPFKTLFLYHCEEKGLIHELYDPKNVTSDDFEDNEKEPVIKDISSEEIIKTFHVILKRMKEVVNDEKFKNNSDFLNIKTRKVCRDTMFYGRLFQRIYQPKLLTDGAILSLDLSGLFLRFKDNDDKGVELFCPRINEEILQMLNGDVPYFWYKSNSKDLMHADKVLIKDSLDKTGIEEFTDKINNISNEDILEQSYLMEASLSAKILDKSDGDNEKVITEGKPEIDDEKILDFCRAIAEKISSRAIASQAFNARWVSFEADHSGEVFTPSVVGDSYYSGYWGIMLFLNAVAKHIKDIPALNEFLKNENDYWSKNIKNASDINSKKNIGISNLGGELISLSTIYNINPDIEWIPDYVTSLYSHINIKKLKEDKVLDVIGGSAGFILGTINILESKVFNKLNKDTKDTIVVLGRCAVNNLIDNITPQASGLAWVPESSDEDKALIGFSHGTSGFITALQLILNRQEFFQLNVSECKQISDIIYGALYYQDSIRNPEGNWCELRGALKKDEVVNNSWCHGLSGIGLGLLSQLSNNPEKIKKDIDIISTLLDTECEKIEYFCCGESGAVNFLCETALVDPSGNSSSLARKKMKEVISRIEKGSFQSLLGDMKPELFPGAFQGVSGIGYTALRLIDDSLSSLCGFRRS